MKHLKKYNEAFWNKKETPKRMSAKEFIEYTILNYKEMENDSDLFEVQVEENSAWVVWTHSFRERIEYHVSVDRNQFHSLQNREDEYLLMDFYDDKGNPMYGKFPNGMTKVNTIDTEITKEEFDNYYKKLSSINDYLFEIDEEKTKGEKVGVGEEGLMNFEVGPMDQIGLTITEHFKKFVGKNFKFETLYYIWSAEDKNERFVEDVDFKLKEFKVGQYLDGSHRLYGLITVECPLDKNEYDLWVDGDYKAKHVDVSKLSDGAIRPHKSEKMSTRKISRFFKDRSNYPNTSVSLLSPSKYDTIEMLKEFVEELSDINHQIKNKFDQ